MTQISSSSASRPTDKAVSGDGKQSSFVTIFSIWNTMMGVSLLSMPWGLYQAGFAFGLFILLFMCLLCLYTSYLVVKSPESLGKLLLFRLYSSLQNYSFLHNLEYSGNINQANKVVCKIDNGTAIFFSIHSLFTFSLLRSGQRGRLKATLNLSHLRNTGSLSDLLPTYPVHNGKI
ncbi:unnamed protein product [Haemonchus placei]|uniref:Aa_trans domain-containing protein n=1 Tax=Haemonchus placei TaxID=6290 RepID=A0A0N4X4Y5_HAEPC|nr:unnamed protein product [Haemonchus placei]